MKKITALLFAFFLAVSSAWGFVLDRELLEQGKSYYEAGEYQEAIETLKEFVSKAGTPSEDLNVKFEGHFYLALSYRAMGDWDTSKKWFISIYRVLNKWGTPDDMKRWSERIVPEIHVMAELREQERARQEAEKHNQRVIMVLFAVIFALVLIALASVSYVLAKLGKANRQLVLKSQQIVENKAHVRNVDEDDDLGKKIIAYMQSEKPYLNPDFSLELLTEALGVNRTYVSSAVGRLAPNFRAFLNSYRIAEAVSMLKENPDSKLDDISSICGFSNSRTFYNAFKSYTGLTPSEYKRSLNLIK
ncbi:MAG: helix-turn-helix domain-containing protein [Bacteroidales bacterium]|nr:helix-turn-helix domain-containing protein [Bacteroidales bacterium]